MAYALSLTNNHELDYKCSPDEEGVHPTKSPFGRPGSENFTNNLFLGLLTSHLIVSLIQLQLLSPGSPLSVKVDDYENFSDDQLESGSICLSRSDLMVGNAPHTTKVQIYWEECKPDKNSEVCAPKVSDVLSHYHGLDYRVDLSKSTQPSMSNYQLRIESTTDCGSDISHSVCDGSALRETATKIYGELYHESDGMRTHWHMCSRSHSSARHYPDEPIHGVEISASYTCSSSHGKENISVAIQINKCIQPFIRLSLQISHCSTLKNSLDYTADRDSLDTQKGLLLNLDCHYVIREGDALEQESRCKQLTKPTQTQVATNVHERSKSKECSRISQSWCNNKAGKRRRDSEELEREIAPKGNVTKRMCVSDNIGRLACPFYKMDPWKFDQCLAYKMSKMSYVKQHLLRYHDEPDYVTAEQKRDIQRANGRKITSESKWYQVWSILFPGAKRPDTPFVEAHYSSEVLSSIQTFYHKSGSPHILEETLLQVENGCTYREAFDGMLQKIKHQVLGKTSEEGVPLPLNDNFEAEDPDWTVSRKSPATDDQKLLPSSSILATMNNKKQGLTLEYSPELLIGSPQPQEAPFANTVENHGLSLRALNDSQSHHIHCPIAFQDASSLIPRSQDIVNYADDTLTCQMGAIFDFNYFSSTPTTACDLDVGIDFFESTSN